MAAFMSTSPASAAVRSGAADDGIDMQPATLNAITPRLEVIRATVNYDDTSGTANATVAFNRVVTREDYWTGTITLDGFGRCADEATDDDEPEITLSFGMNVEGDALSARATLEGFEDAVAGVVSTNDSMTFTATVQNGNFARQDYRCFSGSIAGDGFGPEWLTGYAPVKLTRANAERGFKPYLAARYGSAYTDSSRSYTKCANIFTDDDGSQVADCRAQFGSGSTWRSIGTAARVDPQGYAVTMDTKPFTRKWVRTWRKAGPKCLRSWKVRGTLYGNSGVCDAALAFHFYKGATYSGGTGSGSFLPINVYPCKRKGRTYTCANAMGDAIRWTPARTRRASAPKTTPARPKPKRRTRASTGCDPNYSGCLKPNVSDYDCRGGGGDGPYYTGPVRVKGDDHYGLDRDSDGLACEES
jgi:hypothetical protein